MTADVTTRLTHVCFGAEYVPGRDQSYTEHWMDRLTRVMTLFAGGIDVVAAIRAARHTDMVMPSGRTLRVFELDCPRISYTGLSEEDRIVAMFCVMSAAWKTDAAALETVVRERAAAWQHDSQYTADDLKLDLTTVAYPGQYVFVAATFSVVQR